VAGTSGGAIVGAGVALQDDATIYKTIAGLQWAQVQQPLHWYVKWLGVAGKVVSWAFDVGFYNQAYVKAVLDSTLESGGVTTWGDLDKLVAQGKASNLCTVAYDEQEYEAVVFPNEYDALGLNRAEQPVDFSLIASSAIPNGFPPPYVMGTENPPLEHHYSDGGPVENYPYAVAESMDPTGYDPQKPSTYRTIGVCLDQPRTYTPYPSRNILRGLRVIIRRILNSPSAVNQSIRDIRSVAVNTIVCDSQGISSSDYSLTQQQIQQLYMQGRAAAATWAEKDAVAHAQPAAKRPTVLDGGLAQPAKAPKQAKPSTNGDSQLAG
jgi:predicted acylesterase/phospholipase RssA